MNKIKQYLSSRDDFILWCGCAGYVFTVVMRHLILPEYGTVAIWPAAGILISTLILSNKKLWPRALVFLFFVNLVINLSYGNTVRSLMSIPECAMMAYLIRRFCPPDLNFANPRTLATFLLKALLPTCTLLAAAGYFLPNPDGSRTTLAIVTNWFVSHALGAAITVPVIVTLLHQRRFSAYRRAAWELPLVCALITAGIAMQFSTHSGFLSLLVFPAALFVAFRYGPVGVCWVCSVMLSLAALRIQPDIAGVSASSLKSAAELQWEQVFVATVFLTSLPTAGIVASLSRTRLLLARRTDIARIARRRADQAVRVKTEFLANMSHEIRTPLNGVIGLADALSRTSLDGAQREMLDMILSSGRTLNELVSDALDLARAESGALTLASEPFDVREVVGGACYPFAILAETNGIAFHTEFDLPDKVAAIGDALRIRQIVSNLVSNAVKFTSQGSVDVRISLRPQGRDLGRLSVSVKDTGPGFDAEVKARLFQRFEQADGSVVQKFGGTGLGLAIVRRLADMMQGDVRCEAAPGKGAQFTFEVVLPLCGAVAADEPIAPVASFSAADAAKPRVLVAEDHPINQKVIQALLGEHFDLTIVGDGQAAVDAYAAHPFDVILMDTQMPVMDGLSAIRAIRAGEADRGGRIPIVSLTAGALPTQIQEALEAGADLHMAKPVTANGLLQMMAEVLSLESA